MTTWTLRRTPRAREDLLEIRAYIAADNPAAADRLIRDLTGLFERTADFPRLGRAADWLAPEHRLLARGSYLLIYQLLPDQQIVELVRVVHGARDLPTLFDQS